MVNLAKLTRTVKKVVDTKGDKIAAGVGKATDFVDKKTKGKYREQLEKVDDMAQKLDKTKDRRPDGQPSPQSGPPPDAVPNPQSGPPPDAVPNPQSGPPPDAVPNPHPGPRPGDPPPRL